MTGIEGREMARDVTIGGRMFDGGFWGRRTTATVFRIFSLRDACVLQAGLKSGHLSPQKERGAVRISVIISMREKYFNISPTS